MAQINGKFNQRLGLIKTELGLLLIPKFLIFVSIKQINVCIDFHMFTWTIKINFT